MLQRPFEKSALLGFGILWIGVGIIALLNPIFYFKGAYVDFTGYNKLAGAVLIAIGIAYFVSYFRKSQKNQNQKRLRITMTGAKYCCARFEESVQEGKIVRAEDPDETEWYMPEWLHIYFCPFCGASVKGKGFGGYSEGE